MKKTKFCLIRNCIISGMMFLPGAMHAESNACVENPSICTASYTRADDKAEVVKYLIVWNNDGSFVSFPLEERPRVVCDYEMQTVKCTTSKKEVSFPMDEVHKYTLHANLDELMSVEDAVAEEGSFYGDANSFIFDHFKPGSNVSVYTIDGMMMHSYEIDNDGRLTISTAGWAAGVYLIKTESVTYKVIKK